MSVGYASAIGSHVGMVRSNNQDSGFAGQRLFLVADGMGGHAGGDVASALTTRAMAQLDLNSDTVQLDGSGAAAQASYAQAEAISEQLAEELLRTNRMLRATVNERPELAGMGTTFCGFITVGDKLALVHIGDSRLYLFRQGILKQITKDHTFVQRLVDSGRITEEEAKTHPRRSVLMRVLGDVDSSPDIDTAVLDTRPGDIWLLCSDGLCGYVEDEETEKILRRSHTLDGAVESLIERALTHGAPDNVTVALVQTLEDPLPSTERPAPQFVGSAATESGEHPLSTSLTRIVLKRRALRKAQPVAESHFEPRVDEYLNELIAETKRRNRRRRLTWTLGLLAVIAMFAATALFGYQWTQSRFFVGTDGENVIIYQGVQQNIGAISLSSVAENTGIPLDSLGGLEQRQLQRTLSADSHEAAREIVERLGAPQ